MSPQPDPSYVAVRSDRARLGSDWFWICSAVECFEALPKECEDPPCPRCGARMMVAGRWVRLQEREAGS